MIHACQTHSKSPPLNSVPNPISNKVFLNTNHSRKPRLTRHPQVPGTGDLFFTEASSLWVIRLAAGKFEASTKWEDGFPHLYGNFGRDEVDSVKCFERAEGLKWADVMNGSDWLV